MPAMPACDSAAAFTDRWTCALRWAHDAAGDGLGTTVGVRDSGVVCATVPVLPERAFFSLFCFCDVRVQTADGPKACVERIATSGGCSGG
jgi:hypothetical protein